MAVFIAASDETSGGHSRSVCHYSGWIAPEPDWSLYFTPAWQERVLDGPPKIPYLHMTEMRSRAWREKYFLTSDDAEERLDEAARVIYEMGSLRMVDINIDGAVFKPLYHSHKMATSSGAAKKFLPDFLSFVAYAFGVLSTVHHGYPDAEKVDFMVENNSTVTENIRQFHNNLPDALIKVGRPQLAPLVGGFMPVSKERIPVPAADYLCWHTRRAKSVTLDERDQRRFNTIAAHKGFSFPISTDILAALAEAFTEKERELNGIRMPKRRARAAKGSI